MLATRQQQTNGATPSVTISIVGTLASPRDATLRYIIQVSSAFNASGNEQTYTVRRRYRQFNALHQELKSQYRGLPELPGKFFSPFDAETAKSAARRTGLTDYLRALLAEYAWHSDRTRDGGRFARGVGETGIPSSIGSSLVCAAPSSRGRMKSPIFSSSRRRSSSLRLCTRGMPRMRRFRWPRIEIWFRCAARSTR